MTGAEFLDLWNEYVEMVPVEGSPSSYTIEFKKPLPEMPEENKMTEADWDQFEATLRELRSMPS
jgi:hypothetical protein